jgi:hypothetical protein
MIIQIRFEAEDLCKQGMTEVQVECGRKIF